MPSLLRSLLLWCGAILAVVLLSRIVAPSLTQVLFPSQGGVVIPAPTALIDERTAWSEVNQILTAWGGEPREDHQIVLPAGRDGAALQEALRQSPWLRGADIYVTPADDLLERLRIRLDGHNVLLADVRPWLAERPLVPLESPPSLALVLRAGAESLDPVLRWESPVGIVLLPFDPQTARRARDITRANKEVLVALDPSEDDLESQVRAIAEAGGAWLTQEPPGPSASIVLLKAVAGEGLFLVDARPRGSTPLPSFDGSPPIVRVAADVAEPDGPTIARHLARRRGAALVVGEAVGWKVMADFVVTAKADGYPLRFPSEISRSSAVPQASRPTP